VRWGCKALHVSLSRWFISSSKLLYFRAASLALSASSLSFSGRAAAGVAFVGTLVLGALPNCAFRSTPIESKTCKQARGQMVPNSIFEVSLQGYALIYFLTCGRMEKSVLNKKQHRTMVPHLQDMIYAHLYCTKILEPYFGILF
jgi:hypothetical protein